MDPLTINPKLLSRETASYAHVAVARLRRGVRTDQAQREMNAIATRLEMAYPATNRGIRVEVLPLREESVRAVRPALYVMVAAVASLLVIASLNLAGLLGARAADRAREFALRRALGASRGRLLLQALAEVAPVLAIGGLAGVAAARMAIAAFISLAPAALPRVDSIAVDGPVLGFSLAVLVLTGTVAGLLPAMHAWRATTQVMMTGSRSATPTRAHLKARHALVVAQLALSLPLLVGAIALVRTVAALMEVDPGFRPANVLSLHMAIPRTKYQSDEQIAAFYRRLVDRVLAIPGVLSAGMVNRLPMTGNDLLMSFEFEDHDGRQVPLQLRSVTPGYFQSMSIPVRGGRVFTEEDRASAPLVSIIDERAARSLWPGQSAIGKRYRVSLPGQQPSWGQIVGVVGSVRHGGLDSDSDRQMYFGYHQFTDGRIALVVRSHGDVTAMRPEVVQAIHALDPEQPVYDVSPMTDVVIAICGTAMAEHVDSDGVRPLVLTPGECRNVRSDFPRRDPAASGVRYPNRAGCRAVRGVTSRASQRVASGVVWRGTRTRRSHRVRAGDAEHVLRRPSVGSCRVCCWHGAAVRRGARRELYSGPARGTHGSRSHVAGRLTVLYRDLINTVSRPG